MNEVKHGYVLFDGDCGICSASAKFIQKRDKHKKLIVIPYQLANFRELATELNEEIASKTVCFVKTDNHRVFTQSRAIFEITKFLGGLYPIIGYLLGNKLVSFLCNPIYNLIAKNRAKISVMLGMNACALDKHH